MTHFYSNVPEEIARLSHREAVERYASGAVVPAEAIAGLTQGQLVARPIAGTWSIQEIVVHLADSDLIAAYRMKRIIAEERPKLDVWDENAFVTRLDYQKISAKDAAELFRVNRLVMASILRAQPEAAFERVAQHPEMGEISLGLFVRIYANHLPHHMTFLNKKKAMV